MARRAFTLIELLVVVMIIALLAGILIPVISKASGSAKRARLAADLQTIAIALEAYKQDFSDYPRLNPTLMPPTGQYDAATPAQVHPTGAQLLCWALVGPASASLDGADGSGFRLRGTSGRVYGPYLPPEKFKTASQSSLNGTPSPLNDNTDVLLDNAGNPILYFVAATRKPDITTGTGFVNRSSVAAAASMLYDADQNLPGAAFPGVPCNTVNTAVAVQAFARPSDGNTNLALQRMRAMLGDFNSSNPSAATNLNGQIEAGESPLTTGQFILWSAGKNGFFGPDTPGSSSSIGTCEDVIQGQGN